MKNQATTKVSFLTRILGKLSIRQRLLLIVIIIYIPLMIMGYNIYKDTTAKVDYVSLELEGSRAVKLLSLFNNKVAIHRGLSAKFLGGDQTSETLSSLSRLATELDELDSEIEKTGKGLSLKLNIQAQWDKLAKEWKRIKNNFKSFEPSENYESHTKLIADILSMISGLGDTSGLILDPDYDTFYLMDLAIYKLPYLSENLGKTRAFGVKLLSQKKAEAEETEKMLFMLQDVISYERFS
ncbi:MAG: nitrate- and nitrite sensing domain-containing protein, partial [Leptospiraceae bacterium]|nr:nitrate- and nitrite sensing domain-containing protein [Leptospiraceae bacterium]